MAADFYEIRTRVPKPGLIEVYPEFLVTKSKDLMIQGGEFYAIWDEEAQAWSRDIMQVQRLVDKDLYKEFETVKEKYGNSNHCVVRTMRDNSTKLWANFLLYVKNLSDNYTPFDQKLTFADTKPAKTDYSSKRLPYSIRKGDLSAYDELATTLYAPVERQKFEWAIGAVLAGETRQIQKFIVFHGPQGSGKSTIMDIIEKLFGGYQDEGGYCVKFDAKTLVNGSDQFSLDAFANSPLVALDHEAKLDKIEDNTTLNQIVSHDKLRINEKYRRAYPGQANCMLFMATNTPVKITDANSGVIRRLIDVEPSGELIKPEEHYVELVDKVNYELGAIAYHCLQVYKTLGRTYYSSYRPKRMMLRTNAFFNFMLDNMEYLKREDGINGDRIWALYKQWCIDSNIERTMKRFQVYSEAKNYFVTFKEFARVNGVTIRNHFQGLKMEKFCLEDSDEGKEMEAARVGWLKFAEQHSLLDDILADQPAQYFGKQMRKWENNTTKLRELDTSQTHMVQMPPALICIDFDKKNDKGEKDFELNREAAEKFPPTYAELSNGGQGIHSMYWYDGDPNDLSRLIEQDVEVKVQVGDFALRRRVSKCNDLPIAHISSGLPLKDKKVFNKKEIENEKHLRALIIKALKKEIEPFATKTSIDFIDKLLKDAQAAGVSYDLQDLDNAIYAFAANSSHNAEYCVNKYYQMELRWPKEVEEEPEVKVFIPEWQDDAPITFFDVEVFPNLFLVNYKPAGENKKCIRLINPKPSDMELLFNMKLVGFNCRGYDNFLLYACYLGYNNQQLYELSQDIIVNGNRCPFREALNISYTDVYDFSSKKQGLKKFEIELGIHHQELGLPWDQPVPEEMWAQVAEYCDNDVIATEAVFNARQADFTARKILAEIADMTVNDTTNQLTTKIIFGNDPEPQSQFVYPDLKKYFPEYRFEGGKSYYGEELIGEGGRVYAKPGAYRDVITYDVASMHPSSIIAENGFGKYTERFKQLMDIRIAIKHKDFDSARHMLDGKLAKYLDDPKMAKQLSGALKIAINSVYGLTAAKFPNKFKDPRNVDNWVAKRGALFMESLRLKVLEMGGEVVHIKTDSIKVVHPSSEISDFILKYGKEWGYNFEVEDIYDRICLVNDAVYVAKRSTEDPGWKEEKAIAEAEGKPEPTRWTATGAQFLKDKNPYVFKTLFSKEPIVFPDLCETRTVQTDMYLDMNEDLAEGEHKYRFVGKAGVFCPIKPGKGGGILYRKSTTGKYDSVAGTKGYRWLEAEEVARIKYEDNIDMDYFRALDDAAIETISKFTDFDTFVHSEDVSMPWTDKEKEI